MNGIYFNRIIEQMKHYSVIGGGPTGILSVLKLIQQGIPHQKIVWIDPSFQCGSLSKFNRIVSNIHSNEWYRLYQQYPSYENRRNVNESSLIDAYPYLSKINYDFQQVTKQLMTMVQWKQARVCSFHMEPNYKYNTLYLNTGDKLCFDKTISRNRFSPQSIKTIHS